MRVGRGIADLIARGLCISGRSIEAVSFVCALWEIAGEAGPDVKTATFVADTCVKAEDVCSAARVREAMEGAGVGAGSVVMGTVLLMGYGKAGRTDDVTDVLHSVVWGGQRVDKAFLNMVVDAYVRCGEVGIARNAVRSFKEKGIGTEAGMWEPLVRGYATDGLLREAIEVCGEMRQAGVEGSGRVSNALISGFVKVGDLKGARKILSGLVYQQLKEGDGGEESGGLSVDLCVAYTIVISGMAKRKLVGEAEEVLGEMLDGFHRAPTSYVEIEVGIAISALLTSLFQVGDRKRAMETFSSLRSRYGVRPISDIYRSTLRGLCSLGPACDAMTEAHHVWLAMIKAAASPGEDALARPISRNDLLVSANMMLDGYGSNEAWESIVKLWAWMEENDCGPDVVSYSTVLSAYGRAGEVDKARQLFLIMRKEKIMPDRVAMNALLGACVKSDCFELCLTIFEEMQRVGDHLQPDLTTYSAMIALLVGKNDVGGAWDMYEELKADGLKPNERIIDRMMSACVSRDLFSPAQRKRRREYLLKSSKKSPACEGSDMKFAPIVAAANPDDVKPENMPVGRGGEICDSVDKFSSDVTSTVVRAALDQFSAVPGAAEEMGDDWASMNTGEEGWNSGRVETLMRDMKQIKVSKRTFNRWQAALDSLWVE